MHRALKEGWKGDCRAGVTQWYYVGEKGKGMPVTKTVCLLNDTKGLHCCGSWLMVDVPGQF